MNTGHLIVENLLQEVSVGLLRRAAARADQKGNAARKAMHKINQKIPDSVFRSSKNTKRLKDAEHKARRKDLVSQIQHNKFSQAADRKDPKTGVVSSLLKSIFSGDHLTKRALKLHDIKKLRADRAINKK